MENLNLVTIKKASELTGASTSFFKQLLREKKLRRFKVNSATYISLKQFEGIAQLAEA
ncbi:MAG: hypothetical protein KF856_15780 [Cyclobacteriaceae bacterium]|nr:hypothetical protein [Cyclobacteriaceae bacterium]